MFDGRLPGAPIAQTLDFLPVRIEPGIAVFQGEPKHRHYNPLGTVHGGWFATLLDSALGCAVHSKLAAGRLYTTLELKINLVRALTAGRGAGAGGRQGHPPRRPDGDCRGAPGGTRRQAVCAWNDDLPGVRRAPA